MGSELDAGVSLQDQPSSVEDNDQLLNEIKNAVPITKREQTVKNLKEHKVALGAALIISAGVALNTSSVENVWKWIKLQAQETMATGQLLSENPIGVFRSTFIGYTGDIKDYDQSKLIALKFDSITLYKNDAVRFKSEFIIQQSDYQFNDCPLMVEGILDGADGGISEGNYLTVLACDGQPSRLLDNYRLVAFPPEKNALLAPANYYLYENSGAES
ncbi:hypothetical protein R7127_20790 [Vibrio sp. 1159]|uniref:hypothetical protein n=1 Tax=Vibrio sp. 1159 TaxID=3074545 RepID=UPI002963F70F|nr:hypothetical protein [Vibrio sp. 1159]MDW2322709.1 hypothetical protein [Vibrio sp. 1159]